MPEHTPRLTEDEQGRLAEYKITEKPEIRRIERDGKLRKMNWKYTQYKEGQDLPDRISDIYYEVAEGEDVEATNPFQYINPDTLEIRSDTPEEIRKRLSTQIIQYHYDEEGRVEDGMKKETQSLYHREYPKNCREKIDLTVDGRTITDAKVDVLEIGFSPRYGGKDGHLKSYGKMECTDEKTLQALQNIVWSRSGTKQDGSKWAEKKGDKRRKNELSCTLLHYRSRCRVRLGCAVYRVLAFSGHSYSGTVCVSLCPVEAAYTPQGYSLG